MSPEKPTVSNQSLMKCVYFRIMKAQFVKNPVIFQIKCHMKSKVVTSLVHCVNTWTTIGAAKLGSQMKNLAMKIVIQADMILQGVQRKKKPKKAQENVCGSGHQRACAHLSTLTQTMKQKLLTPAVRNFT